MNWLYHDSISSDVIFVACFTIHGLLYRWMKFQRKQGTRRFPFIIGLATGNPKYKVTQKEALVIASQNLETSIPPAVLDQIYLNSRISTRYMSIPDFMAPARRESNENLFFPENGNYSLPIQVRLRKFQEIAIPLVTDVCKRAIAEAGVPLDRILKLIVVSSTGFLGPSLDCDLINSLGLPRTTDRTLVGFMGCAAAMNGFRIAMDYVQNNPGNFALMVCVELSSVHTTYKDSMNDAILHALFADGAAAAVVTADTAFNIPRGTLALIEQFGWLTENSGDGITLSINDDGISCTLSKHLPRYISRNIATFVDKFLGTYNINRSEVDFWAVHPGGRKIIEEVQNGLNLSEAQTAESWAVLDNYGNMLSPSIMFVLDNIFKQHRSAISRGESGFKTGLTFSFSPGVGIEVQ